MTTVNPSTSPTPPTPTGAPAPSAVPTGTVARLRLAWGAVVVAAVVGIVLCFWQLAGVLDHSRNAYLLDVGVFRDAGQAFLDHAPFYGDDFPSRSGFAFIYPPLAALLFVPLTWLDETTMQLTWTWASVAAAWLVLWMAVYRVLPVRLRWRPVVSGVLGIGALGFTLCLEPLQVHLMYGQINVFLILLVAADLLGFTPRWLRGAGVGVAAGIKITPAAYALVFLVRRRWGDLARSLAGFLATVVVGWIARADQSFDFWTDEFFAGDRGGSADFEANQAITGLLSRAGMDPDLAQKVMIPGLLVIAVIAGWAAWHLLQAGRQVSTLLLMVLAVSTAAPIAVTHHWTGLIVAVVLLASQLAALVAGRRDRWDWPTLLGSAVLLAANWVTTTIDDPGYQSSRNHHYQVYPENGPYSFSSANWFYGNIQGLAGIVCLLLLCVAAWRIRRAARHAAGAE
jgi:alpha-1,2-mannosyltransferase